MADARGLSPVVSSSLQPGTGCHSHVNHYHIPLGVYVRNGQTYCHCLSKNSDCPLAARGRNDAFNVYCIGEGLSTEEALRKLNDRNR